LVSPKLVQTIFKCVNSIGIQTILYGDYPLVKLNNHSDNDVE